MIARVMNLVVVPLAVGLVLFGIECANADSLRWNLQNVTFVDDSIASGFLS